MFSCSLQDAEGKPLAEKYFRAEGCLYNATPHVDYFAILHGWGRDENRVLSCHLLRQLTT